MTEKKELLAKEVPARMLTWPELAMKLIYPQVIERHPDLLEYLPVLGEAQSTRYHEREFSFRVLNARHSETYEELINQASSKRAPITKNLQDEQWALAIKPEWIE